MEMPITEVVEPEEEITEAVETEVEEIEAQAPEEAPEEIAEPESEEVTIAIEGEAEAPEVVEAPAWVKDLRRQNREKEKQLRELSEKLKAYEQPKQEALGPKPSLESCDYDADIFEQKLTEWHEKKRATEAAEAEKLKEHEKALNAYQERLQAYEKRKKAVKLPNYEDAEDAVRAILSPIQQSIIVKHAAAPENVVYVLGNNPAKLEQLKAIQDPIEYALAVKDLESKLTVTKKQPKPAPESTVKAGQIPVSGVDSKLEALRKQAEATGDYTAVAKYKASLRASQ